MIKFTWSISYETKDGRKVMKLYQNETHREPTCSLEATKRDMEGWLKDLISEGYLITGFKVEVAK